MTRWVTETSVVSAAEALGVALEPHMALRIASGAEAAVAAVAKASQQWAGHALGEPGEYLSLLESLAGEETEAFVSRAQVNPAQVNPAQVNPAQVNPAQVKSAPADQSLTSASIKSGAIVQQVEAALREAYAMQPHTHAWLSIEPDIARARVQWLEAFAKESERVASTMPLLGVPLAHKDMFNLPLASGYRTPSCGSHLPAQSLAQLLSPGVATVIQRLELAGAVTIGTLNMAEFALGATGHNGARGDCANAWHSDYVSGGSSSGSAVAVARGAVWASLGSDTGGSVRIPASVNGVLGLKPTYGLIPRTGSMRLSPSIDVIGPIARSAQAMARVLSIVAGADGLDPACSRRSVPDYERAVQQPIEGLRVGIPDHYFFDELDAPVSEALKQVRARLEAAGAVFVPVEIPDVSSLAELSRAVVYAEATGLHASMLRDAAEDYSPQVRLRASTGLGIPAPVYLAALGLRRPILQHFVEQVFSRCEALFTPTIPLMVPRRDATDVGAGESLWPILARLVRCTAPINFLGLPAISVPAGLDPRGLPIGAQLVGRPFSESILLRLAAALPFDLPSANPDSPTLA